MEVGDEKNECKTNDALYGGKCNVQCGRYPLVPAYFAALYLERVSGPVLLGMMYIGMFVFMPTAAAVKYAVALVVVMGAIRLVEWANEGCPSYMAGSMAAIITMILSVAGGLLEWKDQPGILAAALEGAFILGAVILFNRALHMILHWGRKAGVPERPDGGREERLMGYAESFQGLSQVFHSMSAAHQNGAAEELGQIQNELTGKICALIRRAVRDPFRDLERRDSRGGEKAGACTVLQAQQRYGGGGGARL